MNRLKKILVSSLLFVICFAGYSFVSNKTLAVDCNGVDQYTAQCVCTRNASSQACSDFCKDIKNANLAEYNSVVCSKIRLGLSDINTDGILIKREPKSLLVTVYQTILGLGSLGFVLLALYQLFKVAQDTKNRAEHAKSVGLTFLAFAAFLSVGGIVYSINRAVGGNAGDLFVDCEKLKENGAQQSVIDDCEELNGVLKDTPIDNPEDCENIKRLYPDVVVPC